MSTDTPAQWPASDFRTLVAARKWSELRAEGCVMKSISFEAPSKRGTIDPWGVVRWDWSAPTQPAQEPVAVALVNSFAQACAYGDDENRIAFGNQLVAALSRASAASTQAAPAPAAAELVEALQDLLSAETARPSCQAGLVGRCKCIPCARMRSRAAISRYQEKP